MNIVAISGSLRKGSINTAFLNNMQALAPEGMFITTLPIRDIPLYDQDDEVAFPQAAQALKDAIESADGLIIVTPEYNRSLPGVLKNAIDWATRPEGKNSFLGKPVLTAGVTFGRLGTAVAQTHLKQILVHLGARVIGRPELYIGGAKDVFDENGTIVDQGVRDLLMHALQVFAEEVRR